MIRNALTIDVEDYFQVSAFSDIFPVPLGRICHAGLSIMWIEFLICWIKTRLKRLFTLGWIAERYPAMVKRIAENGHELASHGYAHHRVTELSREQFYEDVTRSKALLEDISGQPVKGYRAPSFSINGDNLWALENLEMAGYRYSSSVYPVKHDHYGMPNAPRFAFTPDNTQKLLELPVTTVSFLDAIFQLGGGYFRLWPYVASRWFLQRVNRVDHPAGYFYFHPWEIDPDQPRQTGISFKTRFRHYLNLGRMEKRLDLLTQHFSWGQMDQIFL